MADVRLGVAIDATAAEAGASRVTHAVDQMGRKVQATQGLFKSVTGAIGSFASGLFSLQGLVAGVSVSAIFGSITNTITGFNAAMSDLSAITGATGSDLLFLRDAAKEFGATTTLSASQAAEAMKLIASAKPDLLSNVDALKMVTKETITLAEAAGVDLPQAASALGQSLNQFGVGAEEAARFVNVLAAGAKFGASEIPATAAALVNAGTAAKAAGLSFEETVTSIQLLAKTGITAEQAGTKLSTIFTRLQVQANDKFNPAIVGISQALKNLRDANLSTAQAAELFGQFSINAGRALISQADAFDPLNQQLTGTQTAMEQASIKADDLSGDFKSMGSAAESLRISLGERLEPALRSTIQSFTQFIRNVNDNLGAIGEFISAMVDAAAAVAIGAVVYKTATAFVALQDALAGIGSVIPLVVMGLKGMLPTMIGATAAIKGMVAAVLTGPAGLAMLATGIAYVTMRYGELSEEAARNRKAVDEQVGTLKNLAAEMGNIESMSDEAVKSATERTIASLKEAKALRELTAEQQKSSVSLAASIAAAADQPISSLFTADYWKGNFKTPASELRDQVDTLDASISDAEKRLQRLTATASARAAQAPAPAQTAPIAPAIDPEKVKDARESLEKLQQQLTQQVETFDQSASAVMRYRLSVGDLSDEVKKLPTAEAEKLTASIVGMASAFEKLETTKQLNDATMALKEQIVAVGAGPVAVARYSLEHGRLAETLRKAGADAAAYKEQIVELNRELARAQLEDQYMDPGDRFKRRIAELRELGLSQQAFNAAAMDAEEALFREKQARAQLSSENQAYIALQHTELGVRQALLQAQQSTGTMSTADVYEAQNALINDRVRILKDEIALWEQLPQTISGQQRIAQLNSEIVSLQASTRTLGDDLRETFQSSMEDSLASVLRGTSSMKDAFNALADAVLDQMARMFAQETTSGIMGAFGGGGGGGGGAGGSILGSIFGSIFGARARGGDVAANRPYLVGERRPEIFVPPTNGRVEPVAAVRGGDVSITVVTPDADSFRASRDMVAREYADAIGHSRRFS